MTYHLQFRPADGHWHTIEASGDLRYLTVRRRVFCANCDLGEDRIRIVDANPPRVIPMMQQQAPGWIVFATVTLVILFILMIGMAFSI